MRTGEEVTQFTSVFDVIRYAASQNPARAKSVNVLQDDRTAPPADGDLVWLACHGAVTSALRACSYEERFAFTVYYLGSRHNKTDDEISLPAIGKTVGRSERTVRRWLNKIVEEIERISVSRELIPVPDNHSPT